MGDDGRGAARVTMEGTRLHYIPRLNSMRFNCVSWKGDVTLSAEDMSMDRSSQPPVRQEALPVDYESDDFDGEDDYVEDDYYPNEDEEHHDWFLGSTAVKFLLAGGIAGAGKCDRPFLYCHHTNVCQFQEHAPHPLTVSRSSS